MATHLSKENFPEANDVLQAAPGTESQVSDLAIFRQAWPHVLAVYNEHLKAQGRPPVNFPEGPTCVISKWKFTPDEMHVLNANGGEFYLQFAGGTHSPVAVWGTSPWAPPAPEPVDDGGLDKAMEANANNPEIGGKSEPDYVGDYISPEDARREEDDGPEIDIE